MLTHSTIGSAEGGKRQTKPVINEMDWWRKMQGAVQDSSTMLLMLVAFTIFHFSTVQANMLNICVNTDVSEMSDR